MQLHPGWLAGQLSKIIDFDVDRNKKISRST